MKNNWIDVLDESLVKDFYNNQTSEEQQEGLNTT
ncbi:Phosphoglucomutase, partial [human gut metagenome]